MSATTESVTGSLPTSRPEHQVDVRGPRLVAWVTTAVLIVALLVSTVSMPAAAAILGCQLYPLVARFRRVPA
jgi:hypothetical protein